MGCFGGRKASIMTKTVTDTLKKGVATPMSEYLKSNIGKGLPHYEGTLSGQVDQYGQNAYSKFMKMDAGDWYNKAVYEPSMKDYKRDVLPVIREGYAGNLRGSGRYSAEESGLNRFSESLAQGRYKAERDIPQLQFNMALNLAKQRDVEYGRRYNDWMKSLPQANPVLGQALTFLNEQTSSGTHILSAKDPGQKSAWGDLIKSGLMAAAMVSSGGTAAPLMATGEGTGLDVAATQQAISSALPASNPFSSGWLNSTTF